MGKTTLRSSSNRRRRRGFKKRKPRMKLLPGSGKKGQVNGIDFDGYEPTQGDVGFQSNVYLKEESNYARAGITDGYEGEADEKQVEWEEDKEYTTEEEYESESEDEKSDSESCVSDWSETSDDDVYSVTSD